MRSPVVFGHLGPTQHGVRRYGHLLAAAVGREAPVVDVAAESASQLLCRLTETIHTSRAGVVHLQYSDHLLPGEDFDAPWFSELHQRAPTSAVVTTMHDLPYVGHDDARRDARRAARYRAVADRADLVVVASTHEQQGLWRAGHRRPATVIPHLVEQRAATTQPVPTTDPPTVGILGFVYPGKGHDRVIEACAKLSSPVRVVVLGRASAGHDSLLDALRRQADLAHVDLFVTGWIPDDELGERLASVTVPVAPHAAPSASGSIATWWSALRRPIVPCGRHADHLLDLHPTGVVPVAADSVEALSDALTAALRHPSDTALTSLPLALTPDVIGRRHVLAYRQVHP